MDEIVNIEISDIGVDLIKRRRSNMVLLSNPPKEAPDEVWKEVYRIVDGKLKMMHIVKGQHSPEQITPEQIIF